MKIGIIGTGVMGKNHLRVAQKTAGVEVSALYDIDINSAKKTAEQFNIPVSKSIDELCSVSDAVTIVTPAFTHSDIAMQCMKNNCHVLLEKPIDTDIHKANALVDFAEKSDRI